MSLAEEQWESLRCESCGKTLNEIRGSKYAGDYCLGEIRLDPGQGASRSDPPIEPSYYFWCDECKNDSSEHFTDATKMIGFDLEKGWAEVATASARRFSESREQARIFCAEEILPDALDENERLRASLVEHEEHENQTHEVLGNILGTDDTLENVAKRAAARIKELEAALKSEKAGVRQYQKWLVEEVAEGMSENGFADDDLRQKACDSLILDGKIGPGTVAPQYWQITEEREAAVDFALEYISDDANDSNDPGICFCVEALRAMLTEAGQ